MRRVVWRIMLRKCRSWYNMRANTRYRDQTTKPMIDSDTLQRFMREFLGYGSATAATWFVGLEEGGGKSENEIAARLNAWQAHNHAPIVDAASFHRRLEFDATRTYEDLFFGEGARIQSTWGPLIRLARSLEGQSKIHREQVRKVQKQDWGRVDSKTCLVELFPLPSPGKHVWNYDVWSDISSLSSRERYEREVVEQRISLIREGIESHRPSTVVFYGVRDEAHWSAIAGTSFRDRPPTSICITAKGKPLNATFVKNRGILFASILHPTRTKQSTYFEGVGARLKADLREAR